MQPCSTRASTAHLAMLDTRRGEFGICSRPMHGPSGALRRSATHCYSGCSPAAQRHRPMHDLVSVHRLTQPVHRLTHPTAAAAASAHAFCTQADTVRKVFRHALCLESLPMLWSDLVRVHPGRPAAHPTATGWDEELRARTAGVRLPRPGHSE